MRDTASEAYYEVEVMLGVLRAGLANLNSPISGVSA
jgi:hypothetical protein